MSEELPAPDRSRFPALKRSDIRLLRAESRVTRIYVAGGAYGTSWDRLRTWGPTGSRFDTHPEPPGQHRNHGVLYGAIRVPWIDKPADPLLVVIAEVFRDRGVVEPNRDQPYLAVFAVSRPLRLLDLSDTDWVTRAGGNAAISAGARVRSRAWARAIAAHYSAARIDGLVYASSNVPNGRVVALWHNAASALPDDPLLNIPLSTPALRADLERIAGSLHLGLNLA